MSFARRNLKQVLKDLLLTKEDMPEEYPGLLGILIGGVKTVQVSTAVDDPMRDYVYVRLRGHTSELVRAFNDSVGPHYDLPVIVVRDRHNPQYFRVKGRDIPVYRNWGFAYLPNHGEQHSFGAGTTPGSDVVWVHKRQIMPMLLHPYTTTGSVSAWAESDYYLWGGQYKYFPGTGTVDLIPVAATLEPGESLFITVYVAGATNTLGYATGTPFNLLQEDDFDVSPYIAVPDPTVGIPIGAVLLNSDTTSLDWTNFYDIRAFLNTPGDTGYLAALHYLDGAQHTGTLPAVKVTITDTADYYVSNNVEGALQEIGPFTDAPPVHALDGAQHTNILHALDGPLHTGTLPATSVTIVDAGGFYTGTNVEQALQEVGQIATTTTVRKNSTGLDFTRDRLNLIEGPGVVINLTDDIGDNEIDITFSGTSLLQVKEIDGVPTVSNVTTIRVSNGVLTDDGGGQVTITMIAGGNTTGQFVIVFDGGGSALIASLQQDIIAPFNGTITGWTILVDVVGSAVVDIWKDTYTNYPPTVVDAITGSAKPTLVTNNKAQSSILTGWTTAITSGDILRFNLDSVSTITKLLLVVDYNRP